MTQPTRSYAVIEVTSPFHLPPRRRSPYDFHTTSPARAARPGLSPATRPPGPRPDAGAGFSSSPTPVVKSCVTKNPEYQRRSQPTFGPRPLPLARRVRKSATGLRCKPLGEARKERLAPPQQPAYNGKTITGPFFAHPYRDDPRGTGLEHLDRRMTIRDRALLVAAHVVARRRCRSGQITGPTTLTFTPSARASARSEITGRHGVFVVA